MKKSSVLVIKNPSDVSAEKFAEQNIAEAIEECPKLKKSISLKIQEIDEFIQANANPLDSLAYVTFRNLIAAIDKDSDVLPEKNSIFVEMLQDLVLRKEWNYNKSTDYDKLSNLDILLNELLHLTLDHISSESMTHTELTSIEREIYHTALVRSTVIRGEANKQHYKLVATELFNKPELKIILEKKGFNINQYYDTLDEINRQIVGKIKEPITRLEEKHKAFRKFVAEKKEANMNEADILTEYKKTLNDESNTAFIDALSKIGCKENFQIELNESINKALLDVLSITFSPNNIWNSTLEKTLTDLKPIIKVNDSYYCFLLPHLIRNVIPIIEQLFDDKEFDKYVHIKSQYYEDKTGELLTGILPNAKIYKNLHYNCIEGEFEKWPEVDGLLIYKNILIIIEVKSNNRRDIRKRDVLDVLKTDFKKNLDKAFQQSKRALDYINSNEEVYFEKEKGKPLLKIKEKDFQTKLLLNITAKSFYEFSTNLNISKLWDAELLQGDILPFSVDLYDLIIIIDILENPDDFLDYVKERIALNKAMTIQSQDEIDLLGYFLDKGDLPTFTREGVADRQFIQMINGYDDEISKYYAYQIDEYLPTPKPKRFLSYKKKLERKIIGKNHPCWCDSTKKYKMCCGKES